MGRLCETDGLTEDQTEILKAVRTFVDERIIPVATELEHADEYPTKIVEGLKELGLFGLMIPEEYDGLGEAGHGCLQAGTDRARTPGAGRSPEVSPGPGGPPCERPHPVSGQRTWLACA